MSRNAIIGIVVALFVVLGIFVIYQSKPAEVVENSVDTSGEVVNTPGNNPSPVVTSPQAAAPIISGGSNVSVSNSTAVLTGKVTPNGALTTYIYEYGETDAMNYSTSAQTLGSSYSAINAPAYITGLKPNTVYYFRLSAQNAFGGVHGSTYSFKTNNTPPTPAIAPSVITSAASEVSRTTANLNAEVNPKGSETTYWFEYGQNTDFANDTATKVLASNNTSASVSTAISNLAPSTKYYFRINAQNQYGTVNGKVLTFTTSGPAAPGNPISNTNSASNISTSTATLNGKADANGANSTYWFEYSRNSLSGNPDLIGTPVISLPASTISSLVSVDLSNLSRHTKYYFRLVVKNQYASVNGSQMSFTTK